jgi:hypothetical protein
MDESADKSFSFSKSTLVLPEIRHRMSFWLAAWTSQLVMRKHGLFVDGLVKKPTQSSAPSLPEVLFPHQVGRGIELFVGQHICRVVNRYGIPKGPHYLNWEIVEYIFAIVVFLFLRQ